MGYQVKKHLGVTLFRSGAEFRVWAPFAKSVAVATPYVAYDTSNQVAMQPEADGYWSVLIKGAEAGQTYKFLIDTGTEILHRNDPRAKAVTTSDNGDSVIVANNYKWDNDQPVNIPHERQIIYEMHIGTFNRRDPSTQGTFYDAIEKLDYLKDLGITMIELMPVTSMARSHGWGYNTNAIFSVENAYGGRHGLMEFVKACHQRGIGVILDLVYNHFIDTDLWQYDGWSENGRGGIYFYNDERGDTPWGGRPDYGRPEVRQFIIDNVVMWLKEYHIDGIRLDSTAYMRNTTGSDDARYDIDDAWTLLQAITWEAHKIRPDAIMIAEDTSSNEHITKPHNENGCGFDAQWQLNFAHAIRHKLGMNTPVIVDFCSELLHTYNNTAFKRITFSDSHDTAANGRVRLNEAATPGNPGSVIARQRTILASALTITSPGIPMMLQGQEFMQEGAFNDWQLLEWEKIERFGGIIQAHKDLIALRLNTAGVTAGLLGQSIAMFHEDDQSNIIGYHRWDQGGPSDDVLVIANFSGETHENYWIRLPIAGKWQVRFNSSWKGYSHDFHETTISECNTEIDGAAMFTLHKYTVLILSQDR